VNLDTNYGRQSLTLSRTSTVAADLTRDDGTFHPAGDVAALMIDGFAIYVPDAETADRLATAACNLAAWLDDNGEPT
jgi:hypothetical protein